MRGGGEGGGRVGGWEGEGRKGGRDTSSRHAGREGRRLGSDKRGNQGDFLLILGL